MSGTVFSVHSVNPIAQGPAPAAAKTQTEGFTFGDFLDIINPLQHFPVISTLYRHLTGDEIGLPEKIAGDGLYGGVIGLACSLGDAVFEEITGKNLGDTVYAFVTGEDDKRTAGATGPVSVTPASSLSLSLPDFSGLLDAQNPTPDTLQRAASAYRSAIGCTLQAY